MSFARDGKSGESSVAPHRRVDLSLLLRAALLAAIGFAVTFTAPLHEDVAFNRSIFVVLCAALVALAAAQFFSARRAAEAIDRWVFALGAIALLAGVATLATSGAATFAFIVTVWAALGAVIELWRGLRLGHRESIMMGVLSGLLAIALTLAGGDPVAVIGFLGAYGILAGVYLAIAAFDFSPAAGATPVRANPLDTETAGS